MTDDGDHRLSKEAQDLDDRLRGVASDLGVSDVKKKRKPKRKPWKVTFLFLIFLMAAIGVLYAVIFEPDLFTSQSEALVRDGAVVYADDQGAASNEQSSETAGPIGGTWAMYWTNIEGNENVGFTLRFMDDEYGTVEFPYDDRAYDGRWDINGDQISFGFARDFDGPSGSVTEWSSFEGTLVKPDLITGNWLRDDWSCTPDDGCSTKPVPKSSDSRLVRQP